MRPSQNSCVCSMSVNTSGEKSYQKSVLGAGAREVRLIEEPMAAAIGAGLPVEEAFGSMVVDIGGGTTEVAILALNGVVYSNSLKTGGDRLNESIISYLRRKYGILIGESTAERIKETIGCATPESELQEMEIRGRNLAEGVPNTLSISSLEVYEAMSGPYLLYYKRLKMVLSNRHPN